MKLYGKELDKELAFRRQSKEARRGQRLTIHEAAKKRDMKPSELLAYEAGYDVCPHEKWEDSLGGIPAKFIFKQCKKCHKVDENSMSKIKEDNIDRAWRTLRRIAKKLKSKKS